MTKWKQDFIIGSVLGLIMLGIRIGPPVRAPAWTLAGAAGSLLEVLLVAIVFTLISRLDKTLLRKNDKKKKNKD